MLLKTHDFTPSVYYNESRDFQFIGRLFDVVLNAVKTNADMLYSIPLSQDSDDRLLELMTLTLGFKPRHEYNNVQLKAFCSAFAQIIRWKGSERAFQLAINALANADGLDQGQIEFSIQNNVLLVVLPKSFKGKTLLRDVLSYILPAGITLKLTTQTIIPFQDPPTTTVEPTFYAPLLSAENQISDLAQVVGSIETYQVGADNIPGQLMQTRYVGDINNSAVTSSIATVNAQPSVTIHFQQDYLGTVDDVDVDDTVQLFNYLTDAGLSKGDINGTD